MLLGNKKIRGDEKNWCVVLNAIQNELEKKKFAQKISSIFSLSSEEASDLVVSTPIILLDNLTHSIATKLKEFLHSDGTQIILTNDIFMKRKCYRTVWPEPPSLSFLHDWHPQAQAFSAKDQQGVPQGASQYAAPVLQEESLEVFSEPALKKNQNEESVKLSEELERFKNDCSILKHESYKLRSEVERLHRENNQLSAMLRQHQELAGGATSKEPEKGVKELKALLANLEEKHEVLKEEYREARVYFEERMKSGFQESDQLKNKIAELTQEGLVLKQEKHLKEKDDKEMSGHYFKLKEEHEALKKAFEEKNSAPGPATEYLQEIEFWKEKNNGLERELNLSLRTQQSEKLLRQGLENQLKEFQTEQTRLAQELESRIREVRDWEQKSRNLDEKVASLRLAYETREKIFHETLKQLENRESELQLVREQMRTLKEDYQRKEEEKQSLEIQNHLGHKEKHLKWLVAEQERIESHIRDREEAMKQILAEQQAVEKEIVEQKQKQRLIEEKQRKDLPGTAAGTHKRNRIAPSMPHESLEGEGVR